MEEYSQNDSSGWQQSLIDAIEGVTLNTHGSETQLTSNQHESSIEKIFIDAYNCSLMDKKDFRSILKKNDIDYSSEDFKSRPPDKIIYRNSSDIEVGKNYLVKQPFGNQSYPDFMLFNFDECYINFEFLECKQENPTFNNTPPKRFDHCLYICGNKVFVGSLICSEEESILIKKYIDEYTEFVNRYNQNNLNIQFVRYKKIELRNWPTPYFLENENLNFPLINETLSRFC